MRQLMKFISVLVDCLPEMAAEIMQGWIENPSGLKKVLKQALCPPEEVSAGFCVWRVTTRHIVDLDADPFVPEGWKVEEHIKGGQFEFDPSKVVLHLDDEQKGGLIEGSKLCKKLKGQLAYNANLLEFYLAHPHLIPEEWKGKGKGEVKLIFFWGTIYRDSDGYLCVRHLVWSRGRWIWHYGWLHDSFNFFTPAAVSASS